MDDASRKARRLIEATPHLTLATADASGKPWSNPVYFAHDQAFTLYWVSFKKPFTRRISGSARRSASPCSASRRTTREKECISTRSRPNFTT